MCLENVLPMPTHFAGLPEGPKKLSCSSHCNLRHDNRAFINCRQRNVH